MKAIAKYVKKPVVIEAIRLDSDNAEYIWAWSTGKADPVYEEVLPYLRINTLEGPMLARQGDWVIKGVAGEFYPCRNDIFEATYELKEEN